MAAVGKRIADGEIVDETEGKVEAEAFWTTMLPPFLLL
jgi:hypothetical protein